MKRVILYLFLLLLSLLNVSCISTSRMSHIVDKAMTDTIPQVDNSMKITEIKINADSTLEPKQTSSIRLKSLFIPALLYWQWDKYIKCDIGTQKIVDNFKTYLNYYADSTKLIKKLKNRILYLTIKSIPKEFIYKYKHIYIIFLVTDFDVNGEVIMPQNTDLEIEYSLSDGKNEIKNGSVGYKTYMEDFHNNEWTSTTSFIRHYIYDYNEYLKQLARQVCIDLNKKI